MKALRKLILGETWTLPLGIAAAMLLAVAARALLPEETWDHAGGFVLLALVCVALIVSLAPAHRARGR
jgi:hypothetical protein